ncbi:hypothetical protein VI817_001258 [Penicillium citrinum]|uniref:Uncharacterized protein n=1 Tax=Penicillium hetheringtonii TaxID=911720 RepID=A0AAD6E3S3_9EURO|nr:hypothetical protein N7450_001238 [Penicillium hetheringtonii]KAK5807000.1 hypothetical protein VI817_001258 [Penicillium citrinum]
MYQPPCRFSLGRFLVILVTIVRTIFELLFRLEYNVNLYNKPNEYDPVEGYSNNKRGRIKNINAASLKQQQPGNYSCIYHRNHYIDNNNK